jgi:Carboxypeptidase regulatory-like domain
MRSSFRLYIVVLLFASVASGQTSNQGAISGTVKDQSGAVIPGVIVEAANVDTGVVHSTTSNSAGSYRISFLPPGSYTVSANCKGFRTTQVKGLTVTVGQLLIVDLSMVVGSATEEVNVSATATPLNLETASRGDVIDRQAILNLPLNGREWIQLSGLVPGAETGSVKTGTYTNKGIEVSFNGARDTYNSFYVDGADSTDPYHNTLISSPPLDAVQEFRVETNMYSAQFGRSGGAAITAVTKSGTNDFHGSLYEYYRDKALDALPPFATKPKSDLPAYLFNQFGGSVGGPIKKNKAFFFFAMEKFRQKTPGQLMVSFAPTAAEAAGDVRNTINPYTNQPVVLTDPFTGQVIPSGILPSNLINPVGKTLMDIWSQYKPNYNDPFLNLRLFRGSSNTQDKYLPRLDYNLNERNVIYGSFDWDAYNNGQVGNTPYGDQTYKEHDKTLSLTFTHTFTPSLVNDFKFSRTRFLEGTQYTLNDPNLAKTWGFYEPLNQGSGAPWSLMYTAGFQRFDIGFDGPLYHQSGTTYLRDNLAWVKGKHTIYFGGDFRRQTFGWSYDAGHTHDYYGLYDGNPALAANYGETGSTFTDLLTAMPNFVGIGTGNGDLMPFSRNSISGYIQDDWKVTSRLTLNLGIRWDYEAPFSIDNHRMLSLDFNTGLPRYCAGAPTDLLAIMNFKYEVGGPCRDHSPNYHDFSPRIGFALRPFNDNKTVLRGGYGLFYTSENAFNTTYGGWVQPFAGIFYWLPGRANWTQPANQPINPLLDGQQHFTPVSQEPYGLTYKQGASPGFFYPTVPDYPTGYVEQYNFTVARDLGWNTAMELGWAGSHGVNLNGPINLSYYSSTLLTKVDSANPQLGNFGLRTKGFSSYFNSLQASLKKRMSHGVWFLASYTWGHALTDMSNDDVAQTLFTDVGITGDPIATRRVANADFDVRQRFTLSGIWALPFGRTKTFGSGWNPVVDQILGGWQVNSIITLQGGFPFTVYTSSLKFPDRICDGNLPASRRSATHWFDSSCFTTHTPTTITNPITGLPEVVNTQGNAAPNVIFGPGTNNWDLGLEKNFKVTERVNLQFRGEFFNAFNHLNLQAPPGDYFFNMPSGEQITRAANNRDIQLALRLTF